MHKTSKRHYIALYISEYDEHERAITTTTIPDEALLTTTYAPPHISGCMHNEEFYADGATIPTEDPCEHCYCMKTDIICAIQECTSLLTGKDENCKPRPPPPGQCCPEAYDCRKYKHLPKFTLVNTLQISLDTRMETVI